MPIQQDTVTRKAKEEVGSDRATQIMENGAIDLLARLTSGVINPFKPSPPPSLKINPSLHLEAQENAREVRNAFAALRVQKIKEAAQNKIGQFNAYAAHKGTIPQTVANLYLGRITREETEAINLIHLETSHNNFMASVNALQGNYSAQNQCAQAMHQIKEANNVWKRSLFDTFFTGAVDMLFK